MWTPVSQTDLDVLKSRYDDRAAVVDMKAAYYAPPFYDRAVILTTTLGEQGQTFIAVGEGTISERTLYLLDGNSKNIHDANKSAGIKIDSHEKAESYMRFFCHFLRTEEGHAFNILDDIEGFQVKNIGFVYVRSPIWTDLTRTDDWECYQYHLFMEHRGTLFRAEMAVWEDGTVVMLDDAEIGPLVRALH